MEYKVLNKNQKDRMQVISDHAYVMEWESPEFMDYLLGKLPKVRKFQEDKEVAQEVSALEILLTTYNAFLTKKIIFCR